MADQLSLRLEADQLPDLPDLRPMLPRPLPAPFDSDEHLFEPWWGGERALVLIGPSDAAGGGEVRIRAADGRDLSALLPELAGLAVRVAARSAILDGELVVVDAAGRADVAELARRLDGFRGSSRRVPGVRSASPRRSVAAVAAAGPSSRGAATRAATGRRGRGGPGHRDRGDRVVRGGRRAGDRRDPRPTTLEPVPAGGPQPAVAVRGGTAGPAGLPRRRRTRWRMCRSRRPRRSSP